MNNTTNGFYIHICSSQSDDAFPDNTTNSFRIALPKNIILLPEGHWYVALINAQLPQVLQGFKTDFVRIELYQCQTSIDCNNVRPTLYKALEIDLTRGQHLSPNPLRYIELLTGDLHTLQFNLTDSSDKPVSFAEGALYCTLHFQRL